jgi:hypothetical protein
MSSAHVAAWQAQDEKQRRDLLETAWAVDGVYQDPGADVSGRENLLQHIGGFRQQ